MTDEGDVQERAEALKRLRSLLGGMGSSKVTLIGDVMLDRFHHGYANNLDSTAPVPVLKILRSVETPGAAAHIAMGLNSLGLSVSLHCCVGDDREGKVIIEKLSDDGIDTSGVRVVPGRNTLTKIRFYGSRESLLDKSQILLQADRGPREELTESISASLTASAMSSLSDSCAIVLSDYDKGVLTTDGALSLIKAAGDAGIPVIMDPKLTGLEKSRGADAVLFEIRGLGLLQRRLMASDQTEAAKNLIETYEWGAMLVLGGVHGVTLYQADGETMHLPCSAVAPIQQIGLHDAAATALAAALGNGHSMTDAATLAAAACECVLSAEASHEFVNRTTLGVWLDELAWQLQISDR